MIKRSLIKNINLPAIYKIISRKSSLKLANELNITKCYYGYLVNGKRHITTNLIEKISKAFNIDIFKILEILDFFDNLNKEDIDDFSKYKLALYYLITTLNPDLIVPDVSDEIKGLNILEHFNGSEINIIENFRLANGMSVKDLAGTLEFTPAYINALEKNKKNFKLKNFILLSTFLNYNSMEYIQILRLHELLLQSDKTDEEKNTLFLLGIIKITNPNLVEEKEKILRIKR